MSNDLLKWIKAAAAVAVLGMLVFVVMGYWNDYRSAGKAAPAKPGSAVATASPAAEKDPQGETAKPATAKDAPPKGKILVVEIDGLNFRKDAAANAKPIRGLKKGENLTLVKSEASWYLVKDSKGVQGYVSNNPQYTSVVK